MNKKRAKILFYRRWIRYTLQAQGLQRHCVECNGKILCYWEYDADFCPQCNMWIYNGCGDSNCSFCAGRPETPKEALVLSEMQNDNIWEGKYMRIQRYTRRYTANKRKIKKQTKILTKYQGYERKCVKWNTKSK